MTRLIKCLDPKCEYEFSCQLTQCPECGKKRYEQKKTWEEELLKDIEKRLNERRGLQL